MLSKVSAEVLKLLSKPPQFAIPELVDVPFDKSHPQKRPVKYTGQLPEVGGIYAFWLDNQDQIAASLRRKLHLKGPAGQKSGWVETCWHLPDKQPPYILLYVGKSTNLKNRFGLHLKLQTEKWQYPTNGSLYKPTTSCQLRSGIEHLISQQPNLHFFPFIKERLRYSYVRVDRFEDRFYAEDAAIGLGRPWFNLDSER